MKVEAPGVVLHKLFRTISVLFMLVVMASPVFALTPEQVIMLREAGVEEAVIHRIIQDSRSGVGEVEDESGNRYIRYSTGKSRKGDFTDAGEAEKVERAWEMLRNMVIDARP